MGRDKREDQVEARRNNVVSLAAWKLKRTHPGVSVLDTSMCGTCLNFTIACTCDDLEPSS